MEHQAGLHRAGTFIIYRALGGKEKYERIWPLYGDKRSKKDEVRYVWGETKEEAVEWFNKVKATHGIN